MIEQLSKEFIDLCKDFYGDDHIPLHRPYFNDDEKEMLSKCIDSNYVSSAGKEISLFENELSNITGIKNVIAVVNGTSALHIILDCIDISQNDEVITQALTFVATANAISYTGASPIFVDSDVDTYGMSPDSLESFLSKNAIKTDDFPINKITKKKIKAIMPMHTFGCPVKIREIKEIADDWKIIMLEDCAESLFSFVDNLHSGNFSLASSLSFNGNKLITTGGGGAVMTNDDELAKKIRHRATTSKLPHTYEYIHDEIAYNYRMPNLNAVLGLAQLKKKDDFINDKRKLHADYETFFEKFNLRMQKEMEGTKSNYWLNTVEFDCAQDKEKFLEITNSFNVYTRPIWKLMTELKMYASSQKTDLTNSMKIYSTCANIPSGYRVDYD